ncbi:MAG TPA: LCP family protein [Patescibacteria group bacterium]|nr:LCP family protein [Patescibacteria group bacterium]
MEESLEYIKPNKSRKYIIFFIFIFLLACVLFFGFRAYGLTKKMIVSKSSNASPLLSGDGDIWNNNAAISKLEYGDRRINVLLMGIGGDNHPGGNLTDTMQVISIDPKNKEAAMLSVPRDLYVKVKNYGGTKINAVLSLNNSDYASTGSAKNINKEMDFSLVKSTVGDFLGVPIHYCVLVNFDAFKKIIDIVGGVDVNVKEDLYDPLYPDKYVAGYEAFYLKKGEHHLDGEMALKYARSRETTSDFDRARRQQEIIIALKEKVKQRENLVSPTKISQILSVLADNIKTDLQLSEINGLVQIGKQISSSKIQNKVLDDSADGVLYADKYEEMYVLVPKDSTLKEVHSFIRQYFKDPLFAEEKAKVLVSGSVKNVYKENAVIKELSGLGYNLVSSPSISDTTTNTQTNSTEDKKYPKSFIYDYSNGSKPATMDYLKAYFGKDMPVIVLNEKDKNYDIEIIIGDDYQSIVNK